MGQISLFLNSNYDTHILNPDDAENASLINSHFAQLKLQDGSKIFTLMNDGSISTRDVDWEPSSYFPVVSNDVLLYLLLMGGNDYFAFQENFSRVPYSWFLMKVQNDGLKRRTNFDHGNASQPINDGMFLESLLSTCVCLASHSNGIKGIQLNQFLVDLIYQLQYEKLSISDISRDGFELLKGFDLTVPYLSPPNQDWPQYINAIPGSNFGLLERTKNKDRVDLKISGGIISGESKDHNKDISSNIMKRILKRIPTNSKLEIVFTRKLQNTFFNKNGGI